VYEDIWLVQSIAPNKLSLSLRHRRQLYLPLGKPQIERLIDAGWLGDPRKIDEEAGKLCGEARYSFRKKRRE
jgi:hypothetical protein